MEKHEQALERAKKDIQLADHMLQVTYKLVNEPKMLVSIMERVKSSLTYSVAAILYHERYWKRIPPFPENAQAMFDVFKARCARRYSMKTSYLSLIVDVNQILREHQESPIEFRREDKFVICSPTYRMKVVAVEDIKKYIQEAKSFVAEAERMVNRNERTAA
jgi:hypothetical protein